jgi:hypothetical protein
MRCLKRRISDAVYRQLVADTRAAENDDAAAAAASPDDVGTGREGNAGRL